MFCRSSREECQTIKEMFKSYELALGQMINLDKSMFMVSKNVVKEEAKQISEILGIKQTNGLGIYLGMPSQNNRSKAKMLEKIRAKIDNLF